MVSAHRLNRTWDCVMAGTRLWRRNWTASAPSIPSLATTWGLAGKLGATFGMDILCHGILFLGIGLAIRLEKCMESSWCKWAIFSDFSLEYIGMLDYEGANSSWTFLLSHCPVTFGRLVAVSEVIGHKDPTQSLGTSGHATFQLQYVQSISPGSERHKNLWTQSIATILVEFGSCPICPQVQGPSARCRWANVGRSWLAHHRALWHRGHPNRGHHKPRCPGREVRHHSSQGHDIRMGWCRC